MLPPPISFHVYSERATSPPHCRASISIFISFSAFLPFLSIYLSMAGCCVSLSLVCARLSRRLQARASVQPREDCINTPRGWTSFVGDRFIIRGALVFESGRCQAYLFSKELEVFRETKVPGGSGRCRRLLVCLGGRYDFVG